MGKKSFIDRVFGMIGDGEGVKRNLDSWAKKNKIVLNEQLSVEIMQEGIDRVKYGDVLTGQCLGGIALGVMSFNGVDNGGIIKAMKYFNARSGLDLFDDEAEHPSQAVMGLIDASLDCINRVEDIMEDSYSPMEKLLFSYKSMMIATSSDKMMDVMGAVHVAEKLIDFLLGCKDCDVCDLNGKCKLPSSPILSKLEKHRNENTYKVLDIKDTLQGIMDSYANNKVVSNTETFQTIESVLTTRADERSASESERIAADVALRLGVCEVLKHAVVMDMEDVIKISDARRGMFEMLAKTLGGVSGVRSFDELLKSYAEFASKAIEKIKGRQVGGKKEDNPLEMPPVKDEDDWKKLFGYN